MLADANRPQGGEAAERLVAARGLTRSDLKAIADLESRVIAADGGRLKLEWGSLRSRSDDEVRDLLFWRGGELLGFLGLYGSGSYGPLELAGMVAPQQRRQRIGASLLNAALCVLRDRGEKQVLLLAPRNGAGGAELALARGGRLEHSEHAMELNGLPTDGPSDPATIVRLGTVADMPALAAALMEAFASPGPSDSDPVFETTNMRRLVIERDGQVVGGVRAVLEGGVGRVYGFGIASKFRGQGIGRDVLRRVCLDLHARGARQVELEVLTDNDNALGLYESLGFKRLITEDYYELAV